MTLIRTGIAALGLLGISVLSLAPVDAAGKNGQSGKSTVKSGSSHHHINGVIEHVHRHRGERAHHGEITVRVHGKGRAEGRDVKLSIGANTRIEIAGKHHHRGNIGDLHHGQHVTVVAHGQHAEVITIHHHHHRR